MKNYDILKKRSLIIKNIRKFFDDLNYIEVDTPILSKKTIPESVIKLLKTKASLLGTKDTLYYLLPSPEYYIKQLISNGFSENIYQITKCFRNDEVQSRMHLNEFTMLEYYTLNFDYTDTLNLTQKLFKYIGVEKKVEIRDIFDLFLEFAKVNLENICESENPLRAIKSASKDIVEHSDSDSFDDVFNKILFSKIEPVLYNSPNFVAIINYPKPMNSLAYKKDNKIERWEMFYRGIEICNCYSEQTNHSELKDYFSKEVPLIEDIESYDIDYVEKISNMPKVSGNAIGLDRLIMSIYDIDNIHDVIY